MKSYVLIATLFTFLIASCTSLEQATDTAMEGAEDIFTQADNPKEESAGQQANTQRAKVGSNYDFKAGSTAILQDDFSDETIGEMPEMWKTSGSGQMVTFPGVKGKWLLFAEQSTYKLDSLLAMPDNFTIEFDLLTRSDQAGDLGDFRFGFAHDNSVESYIFDAYNDGAITQTQIHYSNEEVISSSSATEVYYTRDFKLAGYANAIIHVAIQVKGSNIKVYLDKIKVLDTKMFNADSDKYFYISSYYDLEDGAQQAISNFILAK